jgi:hypothetical protein
MGRCVVRMMRVVAVVIAIGGVLVAVVVLFDLLRRGFQREPGDETTDVTGSRPSPQAMGEVDPPTDPKDSAEPDPHPIGNV